MRVASYRNVVRQCVEHRYDHEFNMSKVNRRTLQSLHKAFAVLTAVTTVLSLAGVLLVPDGANAAARPADYGLREGNTISAAGSDDPDVYIVNELGYKRLFLNPVIFSFYGHLGGFASVKTVSAATRDAFPTSGLFRNCEINDQKVYGFVSTGEDTGYLKWVNTSGAQAVADDAMFFNKVFCINNNEFAWYSKSSDYFTSVNQVPSYVRTPGSPSPVAGNLTVSLAADNPAAATVTRNAVGVEILKINLSGTGTLSELTFSRRGPGDNNDYANLYVYDGIKKLTTSGRSLNSSTGTATFVNLNVVVNGSKTLTVIADMGGDPNATVGNVNTLEVAEAAHVRLLAGTVGGSFPVRGNNFTISGATSGSITLDKVGSISNPAVGARQAQVSEFKLTTATEGSTVKRLRLLNGGNVKDSDITNVTVKDLAGAQIATGAMNGSGYLDIDFGAGYKIIKGDNKTFRVYADLAGKKAETIQFYLENSVDLLANGDQYGYGVSVTNNMATAGAGHSLTLQGGDLTLNFSGPTATNIGTDTSDTHFIDFTMTAAAGIELKQHKILLCVDQGGEGTYDAVDTDFSDLEDIKLVNTNTGTILVGPADGSSFTTQSASCPGGINGLTKTFTDTFDILGGQTLNLAVTADVKTANDADNSASELGDADVVKVIFESYAEQATTAGSTSVAKYSGTNIAVGSAQIVPSGDFASNGMTISSSGVTLGLAGSPTSTTYVKGSTNVSAAGFTFRASLASPITVRKVTFTGVSGTANGSLSTSNVGSLINTIRLVDGDTGAAISASVTSNTLSSDGKIQFDNINWQVPAGATKTLLLKADLSTNAVPTNDTFAFDIDATADVTALDSASKTATVTGNDLNGSTTANVAMTVSSAGSLNLSLSPDNPVQKAVYWGQSGVELSRFRFTATNEAFFLEKLTFGASGSAEKADMAENVKTVTIEYKNKSGSTITSSQLMTSGASVNFGFAGDNRPYVPKDSSIDVVVKGDMKTKAEGATSSSGTTNQSFSMDYQDTFATSQTDGFRAVGEGSSTVLDGSSTGVSSEVAASTINVYRVFPKFELASTTGGEPLGTKDVLRFTITAMGLGDSKLLFDNVAVGSGSIKFVAVASGNSAATNLIATTYDVADGSIVSQDTITGAGDTPANNASLSIDFTAPGKDVEITGGSSKTFRVEISFSGFNDTSDFFQLILRDNNAADVNWVDNSTGVTSDPDVNSLTGTLRVLPMNGPTFSKL